MTSAQFQRIMLLAEQQDRTELRQALYELLEQENDDWKDALLQSLKESDGSKKEVFASAWVDAVWLCSLVDASRAAEATRILSEQAASVRRNLCETLESDVLEQAGVLPSAQLWLKKVRLYNTSHYYKQQKFNLLAEESQGYSKLLALLSATTSIENLDKEHHRATKVRELIAAFHLDPNRCLDITLFVLTETFAHEDKNASAEGDSAERRRQALLTLLQECFLPTNKVPALLNFQLQGQPTTQCVLQCMAWLVQQSVLDVSEMWCFLWGGEEAKWLEEAYLRQSQWQWKRTESMARVRLSSSGQDGDVAESASPVDTTQLERSFAVQWLQWLLQQDALNLMSASETAFLTDAQWSQLFFLFPDTLGMAVCYSLLRYLKAWLPDVPWQDTVLSSEGENNKVLPKNIPLSTFVIEITRPLQLLRESSCMAQIPLLFGQLVRVLTMAVQQLPPKELQREQADLINLLRDILLPSLSLFPCNPAASHGLWAILQLLPYEKRYDLYESWRGRGLEKAALRTKEKPVWLVQGELQAGKDARYALKRLSKDTLRDSSRAIAKLCTSHPLVVFTTILNQIEAYDNMINVMVESLRFVPPLSLDVLGFCIWSRLSGTGSAGGLANRSRLKDDGVNVSQWLQSLESFAGAFYKKFPMIEFKALLVYLLERLQNGHVMELGVLRTLLKMSGGWAFADYAPAASLAATQLEGRAGSTLLKQETMSFGIVDKNQNMQAVQEIRRVLQQDGLGVSLLVLLAQVRYQIVFGASDGPVKPVKLIGNLFDTCQVTMAILLDFLTNPTTDRMDAIQKYAKSLPTLMDLINEYKLDLASAWMLSRPLIRAAQSLDEEIEDGDTGLNLLEAFQSTGETRESYKEMLPESVWKHISIDVLEVFYANTIYDFFCPEDTYASVISRLDKEADRLTKAKNVGTSASSAQQQPMQAFSPNDEAELERSKQVATDLAAHFSSQKKHLESTKTALNERIGSFFPTVPATKTSMATFLTRCVYPRVMQGPDDALFCAHFIQYLHKSETPGFSTMHFLDCMIVALSRSLFGLTEGEAANVSILFFETWKTVSRWRYDDEAFANEVAGKPGSFMVSEPSSKQEDENDAEMEHSVDRKEFEHLYNRWHSSIGASCLGCLESSEYMHKRSALIVLSRMVDVFPTRPKLGNKLLKALIPLQDESNTLADIRASAQAYSTQLIKARDDGTWKEEDEATVQARLQKEQAAAEARQKQAKKQMEEMKRDSEKITEEIGEWDGSRVRGPRRDGGGTLPDIGRRGGPPSRPPPPPPPPVRSYVSMAPPPPPPPPPSRRRAEDDHPGLVGRWQRAGEQPSSRGGSGSLKRSRPPSPEDDRLSKRARTERGLEPGEEPVSRGDDGGGGGAGRRRGRYRGSRRS